MLHHAHLHYKFWAEAVLAAAYVRNRVSHRSVADHKTPEEAYSGVKPDVSNLRVFGCDAYVLVPDQLRSKLESKTHRCIFLGYTMEPGTYRLWEPSTMKVIFSRNVVFNELSFLGEHSSVAAEQSGSSQVEVMVPTVNVESSAVAHSSDGDLQQSAATASESSSSATATTTSGAALPVSGSAATSTSAAATSTTPYAQQRPRREKRTPGEWWKAKAGDRDAAYPQQTALLANVVAQEPQTVKQALDCEDASHWRTAIAEELESIKSNAVYEVVERPADRKVVSSKFVFKIKRGADGAVERYKARLVARGFTQQEGVDFDETFAPVVKFATIRTVLAMAAARKLVVHQMDVKTAFLHGELEEEVFLEPPYDVEHSDIQPGKVWRLRKALYGLKQAPRQWNIKLHEFLESLGFERTRSDASLYARDARNPSSFYCVVAVYVDDLLIVGQEKTVLEVKRQLAARFTMSDMGRVQWLLGIEVKQHGSFFYLSQRKYVEDMLERFGMSNCKPASTPLDAGAGAVLSVAMQPATEEERLEMQRVPYRSAVGSLMYLMVATRPDLAAAVGVVSRFMESPGVAHWQAVKRIFRYLRGTTDMALELGGCDDGGVVLQGFCDSDWGGDPDSRRSTTGYIFSLGTGSISWSSKRQATVALSSTEAEYVAASFATREVLWLRTLLEEIGCKQERPTLVRSDNQGAIALVRNPVHHQRTKHIAIQHHFVREQFENAVVDFKYVATAQQAADILTKPLSRDKHWKCCEWMGVACGEEYG